MSTDPNELKVVASVPNEMEAGAIVNALEQKGIQAIATGEYTSGFRAEAPGEVKILVKSNEYEQAKQTLENSLEDNDQIDWSNVDVGEPED
jgi:hypothetical protein